MKNEYWKENINKELCNEFTTADTKRQLEIYNKLKLPLFNICNSLCQKYFSIGTTRRDEMIKDTINHVFLTLKFYKYPMSSFTYCSVVAKNYMMDNIVKFPQAKLKVELTYVDDYIPIDNGNYLIYEKDEIDIEAILSILETRKLKVIQDYNFKVNNPKAININASKTKKDNLVKVINACIEFCNKFECFTSSSVLDYCHHQTGLCRITCGTYIKELFGVYIQTDERLHQHDNNKKISLVQDDHTPATDHVKRHLRRRRIFQLVDKQEYLQNLYY
jgi:hypothetical protein